MVKNVKNDKSVSDSSRRVLSGSSTEEKWREVHGISPNERIWVSNLGHIKRISVDVEDPSTFRKVVYIDGRPVFIDSLVLSVFGPKERPGVGVTDIRYKDADMSNLSIENLEWVCTQRKPRNGSQKKNDALSGRISSMTVTPEMVSEEDFSGIRNYVYESDSGELFPAVDIECPSVGLSGSDGSDDVSGITGVGLSKSDVNTLLSNIYDMKNYMYDLTHDFADKLSKKIVEGLLSDESIVGNINSQSLRQHWWRRIDVKPGYRIVSSVRPDGSLQYLCVRERAYEIAKELISALTSSSSDARNWRDMLHPKYKYDDVCVTERGYNADDFFMDVEGEIAEQVKDGKIPADDVYFDENDIVVTLDKRANKMEYNVNYLANKDDERAKKANLPVKADEIISELKKINLHEMKELGLVDGSRVAWNGGSAKPVIITDIRNMREMYCPSIKSAAQLLGVPYKSVAACVWGKRNQIGYYQVRYKYWGDALHVMSGIYKEYMELIQRKAEDIQNMDDQEFERLSRELEAMEDYGPDSSSFGKK